ncbi:MAG: hypothetical protein BJ554DRAFT_7822, partial [Olpidium bornovanus]
KDLLTTFCHERGIEPPKDCADEEVAAAAACLHEEPRTYQQAISGPEAERWIKGHDRRNKDFGKLHRMVTPKEAVEPSRDQRRLSPWPPQRDGKLDNETWCSLT